MYTPYHLKLTFPLLSAALHCTLAAPLKDIAASKAAIPPTSPSLLSEAVRIPPKLDTLPTLEAGKWYELPAYPPWGPPDFLQSLKAEDLPPECETMVPLWPPINPPQPLEEPDREYPPAPPLSDFLPKCLDALEELLKSRAQPCGYSDLPCANNQHAADIRSKITGTPVQKRDEQFPPQRDPPKHLPTPRFPPEQVPPKPICASLDQDESFPELPTSWNSIPPALTSLEDGIDREVRGDDEHVPVEKRTDDRKSAAASENTESHDQDSPTDFPAASSCSSFWAVHPPEWYRKHGIHISCIPQEPGFVSKGVHSEEIKLDYTDIAVPPPDGETYPGHRGPGWRHKPAHPPHPPADFIATEAFAETEKRDQASSSDSLATLLPPPGTVHPPPGFDPYPGFGPVVHDPLPRSSIAGGSNNRAVSIEEPVSKRRSDVDDEFPDFLRPHIPCTRQDYITGYCVYKKDGLHHNRPDSA